MRLKGVEGEPMQRYAILLFTAAGLTGAALAQGPGPGPGPQAYGLLRFDGNSDGRLTRSELETGQRAAFDRLDGDRNGSVTREEMLAERRLLADEMRAARFARLDADRNGQLSQAELEAGRPGRGDRAGRPGSGHRERGHHGAGRGGPRADLPLTLAEFSSRGAAQFDRADANDDNVVTVAELQAMDGRR
jgi:hypothetical protein